MTPQNARDYDTSLDIFTSLKCCLISGKYYYRHMSVIQKISSVSEYCRCSAAVTMVCMCAEFVDSVARHGRSLQTFEQCLRIVLCVYNV